MATIALFLLILPTFGDATAYFYGATDTADSKPVELADDLPIKVEAKELRTVYNYCQSLPILIKRGVVEESEKTRQICENIVKLLQPAFAKEHKLRTHRSTAKRLFS
ncbi:hypothetical protein AAVH_06626 [Aphelenchoides avenae]|nr:hypothetical protein AAVH_06626 [Aphelenchus avenae]